MLKKQKLGPGAFLKSRGIKFGKSARSLDLAFSRAFSEEKRKDSQVVWERMQMGMVTVQELYALPETREQMSLLFSQDSPRMVASLSWFKSVVAKLEAESLIEFGCGAGYLLSYLRQVFPDLDLTGVERQSNLANFVDQSENIRVCEGDYRELQPDNHFDLVVCDFGWDNNEIPESIQPHSSAEIAGKGYCPGCSDDKIPFFASMLGAWKAWAKPRASLAIAGRLKNLTDLRAIVMAAEQHDWHLDGEQSTLLKVANLAGQVEKFPALIFTTNKQDKPMLAIERYLLSREGSRWLSR